MVNLISDANSFNEQKVRVHGYAEIAEEDTAIYLTETSAKHGIASEGICLNLDYTSGRQLSDWQYLDKKWVVVEGEFRSTEKGHFGLFIGSISNVAVVQVFEPETSANTFEYSGMHSSRRAD